MAIPRQINSPAKFVDKWSGRIGGVLIAALARATGQFGRSGLETSPGEILLVKFCCMGDAVLMLPALRALRAKFPAARIVMLCTPRTTAIFRDCADLDEVEVFELTGTRGALEFVTRGVPALVRTVARMRRRRFALAIDFDNYYNWTTWLGFACGVPVRVGFDSPGQGRANLLTKPVPYAGPRHMVEFYLDLVRAVGADTADRTPRLAPPSEAESWAEAFLAADGFAAGGPIVALSPGRSEAWHFIRWAEERFAEVGERLHHEFGARVLLVGGAAEEAIAARMCERLAARGVPVRSAVGRSNLHQSLALMRRSALLVCNDSGPMHLSAAVGAPTLAVFGPAHHTRWGPYGPANRVLRRELPCSPCLFMGKLGVCPAEPLACLDVPVERVLVTAREMLHAAGVGELQPAAPTTRG